MRLWCKTCDTVKDTNDDSFAPIKGTWLKRCRECERKRVADWQSTNPEKLRTNTAAACAVNRAAEMALAQRTMDRNPGMSLARARELLWWSQDRRQRIAAWRRENKVQCDGIRMEVRESREGRAETRAENGWTCYGCGLTCDPLAMRGARLSATVRAGRIVCTECRKVPRAKLERLIRDLTPFDHRAEVYERWVDEK